MSNTSLITYGMVITYILSCIRIGTKPCKYFQLNSERFDGREGIFSKLEIDKSVPAEWRLAQRYDDGNFIPDTWPVFVKPEWGQNAAGILRADSLEELTDIRKANANESIRYLVQDGAPEKREFEVFALRHHADKSKYAVFSITEAVNDSERDPVNSINNPSTEYVDITDRFNEEQCEKVWQMVNRIGEFNISRTSFRANSIEDLLKGKCHVIEVNLFVPMPIHMLDQRYQPRDITAMVLRYMMKLARITKARDKSLPEKPVFTKIMLYNRTSPALNFLRSKI
ncbi:MAG: hypothetical protein KTR18_05090 [Acidiferrobacterales bacterium]|nr:hypothetical protein [Acidiferrobacterales bacterium]